MGRGDSPESTIANEGPQGTQRPLSLACGRSGSLSRGSISAATRSLTPPSPVENTSAVNRKIFSCEDRFPAFADTKKRIVSPGATYASRSYSYVAIHRAVLLDRRPTTALDFHDAVRADDDRGTGLHGHRSTAFHDEIAPAFASSGSERNPKPASASRHLTPPSLDEPALPPSGRDARASPAPRDPGETASGPRAASASPSCVNQNSR